MTTPPHKDESKKIELSSLAKDFKGISVPNPSSYREYLALELLQPLLIAICLIGLVLAIVWWRTQPTIAEVQLLAGCHAADAQCVQSDKLIEVYTKLATQHSDEFKSLFQLIVSSTLVPLFTLLAGYVFGKGELVKDNSQNGESPTAESIPDSQ
jgi:hypothetical protein